MASSSFDRTAGRVQIGQLSDQPYNNFRVQTLGGPIIQGQLAKIRVAEILFPYATPTIISSVNSSTPGIRAAANSNLRLSLSSITLSAGGTVRTDSSLGGVLAFNIPTGFYTGAELAAAIQAPIAARAAAQGVPAGTFTVAYDAGSGSIVWQNTNVWNGADGVANYFLEFIVPTAAGAVPNFSQPNALWTVGLRDMFAKYPPLGPGPNPLPNSSGSVTLVPSGYPNVAGGSALPLPVFNPGYFYNAVNGSTYTGAYTQYIDVCSTTLCQAQNVRDGNTNQFSIHRDIICRLYVTNDVSLYQTDPTGTRPFVIHRQFKNAKIMKWSVDRSIEAIDIQLYDQFGNFLPVLPGYIDSVANPNAYQGDAVYQGQGADFAITFLVDENTPELVSPTDNVGYRF
jgi:hypothetical protein